MIKEAIEKPLLRRVRESLVLTQPDMANVVGCSVGAIRKYETGERKIPSRLLARIMFLCVRAGQTDLSNEVEDMALGYGSSQRFKRPAEEDPLHSLLNLVIEKSDERTMDMVSGFLQMVADWNTSEAARRQKDRLELFHSRSAAEGHNAKERVKTIV